MAGNERLTLEIEAKTIGESAVDKLAASLEKVVNIASKKPNDGKPHETGYEEFPAKLKEFVENPMQSAGQAVDAFGKKFGAIGVAAAGSIGVIGAIAAASYEATKALGELGVQTQNISIKTGLSTKEVGLFSFAAKAAGSDVGVFETAMRKLSQGIEDGGAEGAKTSKALSELGIRTRELNGDVRPTGQIFADIGEAMEHMESTTRRNALAVALFGKAGIELVPTLMHLKENLKDAADIGLGISDSEQTKFLDLYKKKIEEVDGAWAVTKRHFQEGIAGTFVLNVSGKMANFFDALVTGNPGRAVDSKKLFGVNLDPWQSSQGTISTPPSSSEPSGDAIAKQFRNARLNSKEGIESRITDLEEKNKGSLSLLNGTGIGEKAAQQAIDSINANQKIIDSLRSQLRQMEQNTNELETASRKLAELRRDGRGFVTFGSGKNQVVITDDDISKYDAENATNQRRVNPPSLDGPDSYGREDSFVRTNYDLDALKTRDSLGGVRFQVEAGSDYFRDAGHRDDLAIRNINDSAERQARTAGIGARPEDALAVASRQRDIRMAALEAEKNILSTSLDQKDAADKIYALEQRGRDAQLEYNEKVADQIAKQAEQFRSISGGIFEALTSGKARNIGGFFESQAKDIGRTIFVNLSEALKPAILASIPHAASGSTLGKILQGTPFGPDQLKGATDLNTTATIANTAAIQAMKLTGAGTSNGGAFGGIGGLTGTGDIGWSPDSGTTSIGGQPLGGGILDMHASLPGSGLSTAMSRFVKGAAIAGGGFAAYQGFSQGGTRGALQGTAGVAGVASAVLPLISSSLSLAGPIGMAVAAALPLVASLLGDPHQQRANQIQKTLTESQYFAPTALNESMTTNGNYVSIDSRGNLIKTGFSARPVTTDPYLYWGPGNTPYQAPGEVQSPYSGTVGQPTVVVNHNYNVPGAIQTMDSKSFHEFADAHHQAIGNAAAKNLGSGDTALAQRMRYTVSR